MVDVALFVEKEMPGLFFLLFHDVMSMFESITCEHSKKADVMAAVYQASHMGFDVDEATQIHSFNSSFLHFRGHGKKVTRMIQSYHYLELKTLMLKTLRIMLCLLQNLLQLPAPLCLLWLN